MCRKNHAIRSVATHPKGEGQAVQKIVVDHGTKLTNERSTAGFRYNGHQGYFDEKIYTTKYPPIETSLVQHH